MWEWNVDLKREIRHLIAQICSEDTPLFELCLKSQEVKSVNACLSQERGLDTVDANRALGLPDDCREYFSVRNIISDLGIKSIRLVVSGEGWFLRCCVPAELLLNPLRRRIIRGR